RRTIIPSTGELITTPGESIDPLAEESHSPVPGIVHRYPDRVLFLITDYCSVFCRYCTRSRLVGGGGEFTFSRSQWEAALQYIEATPAIRDVLISGGDPLTLSEDRLEYLLQRLKAIPHVEFIRIGTKVPVVLPQRITPSLVRMLKRYHPLWLSLNFVHPQELTLEVAKACERLADAGIPLGSQTVLLKGVNDSADTLKELFQGLLKIRVRPYYLYQCDPIQGSSHLRTPLKRGLQIMEQLRGFTTGYAVPTFVVDAPGGGGKIVVAPKTIISRDNAGWTLRNYQGKPFLYPEPINNTDNY
ncbi:KamA family radical SAM protein, partial [bacterium]|nr:KamA family radical SAM protein [bacterium]